MLQWPSVLLWLRSCCSPEEYGTNKLTYWRARAQQMNLIPRSALVCPGLPELKRHLYKPMDDMT